MHYLLGAKLISTALVMNAFVIFCFRAATKVYFLNWVICAVFMTTLALGISCILTHTATLGLLSALSITLCLIINNYLTDYETLG